MPALINQGVSVLGNSFSQVIGDMVPVFENAIVGALTAGWDTFNPSVTLTGIVQPTIFGIPFGSPTEQLNLLINKFGLSFSYVGSLTQLLESEEAVGFIPPEFKPISDVTEFDVTLPLPTQFLTSIVTGTSPLANNASLTNFLDTAVSAVSGWQIYCSVTLQSFGVFNLGTATGYIFGPSPIVNGQYQPTALFQQKVVNLDPNNTGTPDPTLQAEVANTPGLLGLNSTAEYDAAEEYGGILFAGKLSLPELVIDPLGFLEASVSPTDIWTQNLPTLPSNPTLAQIQAYPAEVESYVNQIYTYLTKQEQWANLNF